MSRTVKLFVLISILTGFASCSKDQPVDPVPAVPEGYIRAALDLKVMEPDAIQTRATVTEENDYDESNVWAMLFYATSASDPTPTTLVQTPVKATQLGGKLYVLLRATTRPVTLYVVTGLSSALNGYMATVSVSSDFDTINGQLQTAAITATGVPIGSGSYFHMSSEPVFYSTGTIPVASITESLIRNVAKIDVDASAIATSVFQLEGAVLVNGAKKGFVLSQDDLSPNLDGTIRYSEKTTVAGNSIDSQIYLFENSAFLSDGTTPNPTTLIVRGKYRGGSESGYYRMDILRNNGDGTYTPYDIERNTCYTLKIEKIENGGYLTLEEALAAEPSNTGYRVVVDDPNSHDIVSNGHYYLGVSNSEFIVYGDPGQIEDLHIATVTTDAPAGTYTSITSSTGVSLVTTSLATPDGTVTETEIYATPDPLGDGHIDLRVGNLTKRIIVRRKASIVYESSQKTDFTDPEYVYGEVVSGMEWVRLSAGSNADFNLSPVSLTDPAGGIYVRYNSTLAMNASRSAELYAHKADEQGRAKMLLFASAITYVGSTLPAIIDKDGEDINGTSTFNATFSNPGGYPLSVGIATVDAPVTMLMETSPVTTAVIPIDLAGVAVANTAILPRGLTLKYKVNGVWIETERNVLQRVFIAVRILSGGNRPLNIYNGSTVNYGTQLTGPVFNPSNQFQPLGRLFHLHTGAGKPINNSFELFYLGSNNNTNTYNNIGQILRDNGIDIMFLSLGSIPTASQVAEILDWLDENPHRGLIYLADLDTINPEVSLALFGEGHSWASSAISVDPYLRLPQGDPYYNNPVYKAIMCGPYSTLPGIHPANPIDLREDLFRNASNNAYGSLPLSKTNAAGFIPIFYVTISGEDKVLFAVNPERNIVFMGDAQFFDSSYPPDYSTYYFLHDSGSLDTNTYGNYPKMVMNMWAWFINNVALGGVSQ